MCDKFKVHLLTIQIQLLADKEIHLKKVEAAQDRLKRELILKLQKDAMTVGLLLLTFSKLSVLPIKTLVLNFILIWSYNLEIYDCNGGVINMWSEDVIGCGSNEVISALNTYFKSIQMQLNYLVSWSDLWWTN